MIQKVKTFLFTNTSTSQMLVKNTVWLSVSNIVGRLVRALIIIYAARILGTESWGVFAYAISLIATITVLTDFGINGIVTREASRRSGELHETNYLATAFWIKLAFTALGAIFVLVAGPYLTNLPAVRMILPLAALVLVFDTLRDFGFSLTRALQKMEWEAMLFIGTNVAIVIFGFLLLWISPTVEAYTFSYALGAAVGAGATFYLLRHHLVRFLRGFSGHLILPLIKSAWPFALAGVLGGLMIDTDVIIIGWLRSATDVGLYAAAQRIILMLYIIPGIIASSTFPLLARLAHKDNEKARRVFEFALTTVLFVALPIVIGGIFLGTPLIELLFGSEYLGAAAAFKILALTIPMNFAAIVLSNFIFAYDRQTILTRYAAVGATLNIVLDLLFIPVWGIAGSALATLFVQIVGITYLVVSAKRILQFSVIRHMKNALIGTCAVALTTWIGFLFSLPVLWSIVFATLVYGGVLVLRKEPLLRDVSNVLRAEHVA